MKKPNAIKKCMIDAKLNDFLNTLRCRIPKYIKFQIAGIILIL
jgi:hypothetical protein